MGQKEFDILLANIGKMTEVVDKLPDNCREMVYSSMVAALLSDADSGSVSAETLDIPVIQPEMEHDGDERNIAEELEEYYRQFSLDSVRDMDFAAFVAYFFAKLAPPHEMTDRIDESHYKRVCVITGRRLPKRISGTMNNAKHIRDYLQSHGSGVYSISATGEHFVKHTLLKESTE